MQNARYGKDGKERKNVKTVRIYYTGRIAVLISAVCLAFCALLLLTSVSPKFYTIKPVDFYLCKDTAFLEKSAVDSYSALLIKQGESAEVRKLSSKAMKFTPYKKQDAKKANELFLYPLEVFNGIFLQKEAFLNGQSSAELLFRFMRLKLNALEKYAQDTSGVENTEAKTELAALYGRFIKALEKNVYSFSINDAASCAEKTLYDLAAAYAG